IESGEQSSSITRLYGQNAQPTNGKFTLKGELTGPAKGIFHAVIHFQEEVDSGNNPLQRLRGEFDFVTVGDDRFWMISTKTFDVAAHTYPDEVVSGEAVWVGA